VLGGDLFDIFEMDLKPGINKRMNMKNINSTSPLLNRFFILIVPVFLFAFTAGDTKSEYILPLRASSVCTTDLDLDGDIDIIVGHKYSSLTAWGGLSIMENDGQGNLQLADSFYVDYGFPFVHADTFDNNAIPDIFSIHITANPYTVYAGIVYNYAETQFDSLKSFVINYDEMVDYITSGDVNGDGYNDIVYASNTDKFWRVLYNDGTGNFNGSPYYYTEYSPNDIAIGDIDSNGLDDIAIAGTDTEIYFSFETGFEYFLLSGIEHDIELADMENDGDIDVITVYGAFITNYIIYENIGYQNFEQKIIFSFQGASGGLLTPDLNNDSLPEITFMDGEKYFILYNKGNLEFTLPDTITPENFSWSTNYCWGDLDNNSFPDIIVFKDMGIYAPNLKVLYNDGNGNFGENPITDIEIPMSKKQKPNLQCYPNPFKTSTQICFEIGNKAKVQIKIFDNSGKPVNALNQGIMDKGSHCVEFSAEGLPPGIYFCSLEVNGIKTDTRKMTLMK
jgi:hypothetical protein